MLQRAIDICTWLHAFRVWCDGSAGEVGLTHQESVACYPPRDDIDRTSRPLRIQRRNPLKSLSFAHFDRDCFTGMLQGHYQCMNEQRHDYPSTFYR